VVQHQDAGPDVGVGPQIVDRAEDRRTTTTMKQLFREDVVRRTRIYRGSGYDVSRSHLIRIIHAPVLDLRGKQIQKSLSLQCSAVEQVLDILMDILSWEIAEVVSPCIPRGL